MTQAFLSEPRGPGHWIKAVKVMKAIEATRLRAYGQGADQPSFRIEKLLVEDLWSESKWLEVSRQMQQMLDGIPETEQYGWTEQFHKALAQPEMSTEEKRNLLASLILAFMVFVFMFSQQHPRLGDQVQLGDTLIGLGVLVYALHKNQK